MQDVAERDAVCEAPSLMSSMILRDLVLVGLTGICLCWDLSYELNPGKPWKLYSAKLVSVKAQGLAASPDSNPKPIPTPGSIHRTRFPDCTWGLPGSER